MNENTPWRPIDRPEDITPERLRQQADWLRMTGRPVAAELVGWCADRIEQLERGKVVCGEPCCPFCGDPQPFRETAEGDWIEEWQARADREQPK